MSKFLVLWEHVPGTIPTDLKQRADLYHKWMEMVKQRLDSNQTEDWGIFAGGSAGYSISEGTAIDWLKASLMFGPYIKFTVYPVLSSKETTEAMKSMTA